MTIALGALLAVSVSDAKVETLKSVTDNLNFAIDDMSRALRTGNSWGCGTTPGSTCTNPGSNEITFTSSGGVITYYRLDSLNNDPSNAAANCGQISPNVGCLEVSYNTTTWYPLTSPDVIISDLSSANSYVFYVVGTQDSVQPRVIITISGHATVTATQQTSFYLQTSVTQRLYDQ
jgi:hypothetical protein